MGNLFILWLLSLLPSQISSSTLRNAEASLKNEELYAGTRKQSVTVYQVRSYLGKLTQYEKHSCPNNHNEKVYGCCFPKTQNYAPL